MGSTIVSGRRVTVLPVGQERFYVMWEKARDNNLRPSRPEWSSVGFGNAEDCVRKALTYAASIPGGLLNGSRKLTVHSYVRSWAAAMSHPFAMVGGTDVHIGAGDYNAIPHKTLGRFAQEFDAKMGQGALSVLRAGGHLTFTVREHLDMMSWLSRIGARPWSLFDTHVLAMSTDPCPIGVRYRITVSSKAARPITCYRTGLHRFHISPIVVAVVGSGSDLRTFAGEQWRVASELVQWAARRVEAIGSYAALATAANAEKATSEGLQDLPTGSLLTVGPRPGESHDGRERSAELVRRLVPGQYLHSGLGEATIPIEWIAANWRSGRPYQMCQLVESTVGLRTST